MSHSSRADITGSLDMEALMCNLFRTDIAPLSRRPTGRAPLLDTQVVQLAHFARQARDAVFFRRLPPDLPKSAAATLFHERVHYWQVISCPLLQWQFVCFLDKLRAEAAGAGGLPYYICGQGYGDRLVPPDVLDGSLASVWAHFRPVEVSAEMIRMVNPISADQPTAMPYLELPHSPGSILPAYGALLGFAGSAKQVIFPFNGRYLMESAAHLSELLLTNRPTPSPLQLDSLEDQIYLGAWEFWRRLHGERYDDEEDLALAFLAAVDLAVSSDAVDVMEPDSEYQYEMFSIPYRFGKLAYRVQDIAPLKRAGADPAQTVAQFQNDICSCCGWPSPNFSTRKMAVFLTRILVQACARHLPDSAANSQAVDLLYSASESEIAERMDELEPVWELFSQAEGGSPSIGQLVVATMLNACIYRIRNPGVFAIPHLYDGTLAQHFPLPVVLLDGEYFLDVSTDGITNRGAPYPVSAFEAIHDVIGLMAVKSLKRGSSRCGFIDESLDCWFTKTGLGCPQSSLTPEQARIRKRTGLDDWCHWTLRALLIRTAPRDVRERWVKRFAQGQER